MGFDITHAIITLVNFKPEEVSVVTALIDGKLDPRSLVAYNSFEQVAVTLGIRCSRVGVEVLEFGRAVEVLRDLMIKHVSSGSEVILDLGGLRMLVVEALTAFLSLPKSLRKYFKVLLYIEGQNRYIELSNDDFVYELSRGKTTLSSKLSYLERIILEKMEYNTPYNLNQIHNILKRMNENITKQNLIRILNKLIKKNYVERVKKGIYKRSTRSLLMQK